MRNASRTDLGLTPLTPPAPSMPAEGRFHDESRRLVLRVLKTILAGCGVLALVWVFTVALLLALP